MVGLTANATFGMKLAKTAWYGYRAWQLARQGDRSIRSLENRLFDVMTDAASLQMDVIDRHDEGWRANSKTLELVVNNLDVLDAKLKSGVVDALDNRDKAQQYLSRLSAIYFIKDYLPTLAATVAHMRSNTINLDSFEIASVSDLAHLLYSMTSSIRAGDQIEIDKELRRFEKNHSGSEAYTALRNTRTNNVGALSWFSKRKVGKEVIKHYQSFESGVRTKLSNTIPEYNPSGKFTRRLLEREADGGKNSTHMYLYDHSFPLEIKCSYGGLTLDGFNPQKRRKKAEKRGNYFLAECVGAGIISEELKRETRSLDSRNYTLFLRELDTDDLVYNQNSRVTKFFVDYFDTEVERARGMQDFLSELEDRKTVSAVDIKHHLMLGDKGLQSLQKYGLISPVRRRDGHYTLV